MGLNFGRNVMKLNYSSFLMCSLSNKKKLLIGAFLFCVVLLSYFTYEQVSNRPKPVTKFEGLSLNMTMDEVMYSQGFPSVVLYEDAKPLKLANGEIIKDGGLINVNTSDLVKINKNVRDYFYWQYDFTDGAKSKRIDVEFSKETKLVRSIGCYVDYKDWVPAKTCLINGIQSLDSEESIINVLGKPSVEKIEGTTKNIIYPNFNMSIYLTRKLAYYIKVEK